MSQNTMKAIRIHDLDGIDALRFEDAPRPKPSSSQVQIRVHAAACNFADTLQIRGLYQTKPPLPFTPGLEVAGEVCAVGEDVKDLPLGTRVMGWVPFGAFAEYALLHDWAAIPIPDSMDWLNAAAFPVSYGTAYGALRQQRVALKAGETLLVHGAAGGVGLAAVEVGKALGAQVIGTAGHASKTSLCAQHGADEVINYRDTSFRDVIKNGVGGVDVVLDPVGGDVFSESLRCTNTDGRLVVIGFAGGAIQSIASNYLLLKNISVAGFSFSIYARQKPEQYRRWFAELLELYAEGHFSPHISAVWPLEETGQALQSLQDRSATGKVVLRVRSD